MNNFEKYRKEFETLGCAQLYDAATDFCHVVHHDLTCRTSKIRFAAPVFPTITNNDMLPCLQALSKIEGGWALFIDNTAHISEALAGDIFCTEAVRRGVIAIIINGAVRDIDYIKNMDISIWSNTVTYVSAKTAEVITHQAPYPITLDGLTIELGDWLFGDSDGLLLVKASNVDVVFKAAKLLRNREDKLLKMISTGNSLTDVIGLNEYLSGSSNKLLNI